MITLLLALLAGCPHGEPASAHLAEGGQVVMWAMNQPAEGRPECEWPVEAGGALCSTVGAPGATLTAAQAARLVALLDDPGSFGVPRAKCFAPYHGVGFYDASGALRAQVALSLPCEGLRAEPPLRAQPAGETRDGLSPAAMAAILDLCAEAGLPGCVPEPPR